MSPDTDGYSQIELTSLGYPNSDWWKCDWCHRDYYQDGRCVRCGEHQGLHAPPPDESSPWVAIPDELIIAIPIPRMPPYYNRVVIEYMQATMFFAIFLTHKDLPAQLALESAASIIW
jgi:hypothetical protein